MLSLIPAILLLALHGPAAVERFGHEGKLPEALRAVWTPESEGKGEENPALAKQRKVFESLAAMTADPVFSQAVSEFFGLEFQVERANRTDPTDRSDQGSGPILADEPTSVQDGFTACRRTRDGPLA